MGTGIGLLYLLVFSVMIFVEKTLPANAVGLLWQGLATVGLLLTIGLWILKIVSKYSPVFKQKYGHWLGIISWHMGKLFMPGVYRPLNYLTFTFASNLPQKKYYTNMTVTMVAVMSGVIYVFFTKFEQLNQRHVFDARKMFGSGTAVTEVFENNYDNLRQNNHLPTAISLPSETWSEHYLPVFVNVPKWLDMRAVQLNTAPTLPDSLEKHQKRKIQDEWRLQAMSQFFEITVNDSLLPPCEWVFQIKNGNRGMLTFVDDRFFKINGKNLLTLRIPSESRSDSLEKYGEVIFWYFPK